MPLSFAVCCHGLVRRRRIRNIRIFLHIFARRNIEFDNPYNKEKMGKPSLRPTGEDTYVIEYLPCPPADSFDFEKELERSRSQEAEHDFEGACNTRLHAFQRLVELVPDDEEIILDWEDAASQAAMVTGYCSGIDHFLLGDWEMAAAVFEMLLELDPEDHLEASVTLAYTYLAMGEYESFDEIFYDVNDKYVDKLILSLWNGFLRKNRIFEGELVRLKTRFAPYYDEFTADGHPVTEEYLADIHSGRPSQEARARELWLETEHLWAQFPGFIEALRKMSTGGPQEP